MIVYYASRDNGDGSASVSFFRNPVTVDDLQDPKYYDAYLAVEDVYSFEIPDGPNTISFSD